LRCRAFPLDGQVSVEWSRCPGSMRRCARDSVDSFSTKVSKLDACKDRSIFRWRRTQASSHNVQGIIDGRVNEAGMSTAAPNRNALLCCWMDQGYGGCLHFCWSSITVRANELPQECDGWCQHFAKWLKVSVTQTTAAWILCLKRLLYHPDGLTGALTVDELEAAQLEIVKVVQRDAFSCEISLLQSTTSRKKWFPGSLRKLNPMLDNGVVRVGGRLNMSSMTFSQRHPIILPSDHHVT